VLVLMGVSFIALTSGWKQDRDARAKRTAREPA
jgi:hypothetical protein